MACTHICTSGIRMDEGTHTHTHTHPLRQPGEEEWDALLTKTVVKDLIFGGVLFKHLDTCAHILKSERPSTTTLQTC
jgi:hypothetical protein